MYLHPFLKFVVSDILIYSIFTECYKASFYFMHVQFDPGTCSNGAW